MNARFRTALLLGICPAAAWIALTQLFLQPPPFGVRVALTHLLLAPIIEEWIFRGLLTTELKARGVRNWQNNLLVSMLFAAIHFPGAGANAAAWLFPSLALGWYRLGGAGLPACMFMHAWMNAWLLLMHRLLQSIPTV